MADEITGLATGSTDLANIPLLTELVDGIERIKLLDAIWFQVKGMTEALQTLNNILAHLMAGAGRLDVYPTLGVDEVPTTSNLVTPEPDAKSLSEASRNFNDQVHLDAVEFKDSFEAMIGEQIETFIKVIAGLDRSTLNNLATLNYNDRAALISTLAPSFIRIFTDRNSTWGSDNQNKDDQGDGGEIARSIKEIGTRMDYDSAKWTNMIQTVRDTRQIPLDLISNVDPVLRASRDKALVDDAFQINTKDANPTNDAPPGYIDNIPI